MSSHDRIDNVDGNDDSDYDVIKSDQEDDGGFDRCEFDTESFDICSSQRSTTVNCDILHEIDSDENISDLLKMYDGLINPEESYTYGIVPNIENHDKLEIIQEETINDPDEKFEIKNTELTIDLRVDKLKRLIFNIYSDLSKSLLGYKSEEVNIIAIIDNLNHYFSEEGISLKKFPIESFINESIYNEIINYFEESFYKEIRNLTYECNKYDHGTKEERVYQNKIDDHMYQIEEALYKKLFMSSSNSNISTNEYWDLNYDFIIDLSEIFGLNVIFNCSLGERTYSLI